MEKYPFVRDRLYCPGPTPVPAESAQAALRTNVYHRTDAFRATFLEARALLQPFFAGEEHPLILSSSGTGAMEAGLANLTRAGDKILVLNGGKFGERWKKMGAAFQCELVSYDFPWGEAPEPQQVEHILKTHADIKAVFLQANETSTGVAYPVRELCALIRAHSEALIVVDAISALVAHHLPMQELGIDCLLTGSQKGFGIPPGLAFIALSRKAWASTSDRPRFYFDLKREREGQAKGETAWTPAITLVESLLPSLRQLNLWGPLACAQHHQRMALASHRAAEAMHLKIFAKSHPSHALTALEIPAAIDGSKLVKVCRERFGTIFAGGQDHLKGKIIRLAHLGLVDELDLISGIAALEMGLKLLGSKHSSGAGVGAAMDALRDNASHALPKHM